MSAPGRSFKRTIVGRRMPMGSLEDELLPRWIALPIFASDPLSSVAYATEAALVVLMATSVASRGLIIPISAVIALLLIVVVLSYRQTIFAYPNGGGSYVVAKENLGPDGRARRRRLAAHRLRAHGGGLDRLGRAGGHLGRARALHRTRSS